MTWNLSGRVQSGNVSEGPGAEGGLSRKNLAGNKGLEIRLKEEKLRERIKKKAGKGLCLCEGS